jgi:beta-lactamase class D
MQHGVRWGGGGDTGAGGPAWTRAAGGLLLVLVSACGEAPPTEAPTIAAAFAAEGAVGTMLIRRLGDGREWVHDAVRADTPFIPASTFKIVNAAIALETGAVSGPDELFPWDGEVREFEGWNRDLTLAEAMAASAVPVYQEVARRVGEARMREWLQRLDFGNADPGTVIDRFWLDGPLLTSARDQVDFLQRLVERRLPLSQETHEAVEDIVLLDGGTGWALHGKTGWAFEARIGWWVGWTRHDGDTWVFALNMDMPELSDAAKRVVIGRAALESVGALPGREAGGGG